MIAQEARPSKAAVRAALLSARLYHDTLGDKSMLRYAGFGVLEPKQAFDILKLDSEAPNPYVPWLSLYRLGLAYETFRASSDKWLQPIAINAVDLKVRAAQCAPDLLMVAEVVARPWWKKLLPLVPQRQPGQPIREHFSRTSGIGRRRLRRIATGQRWWSPRWRCGHLFADSP